MDAKTIVGWNLRRYRVALGLSQEKLALEAGIDRSYVGRVERGSENVTIVTLEALAKALNISLAALFEEPKPGASKPKPLSAGRKFKSPKRPFTEK